MIPTLFSYLDHASAQTLCKLAEGRAKHVAKTVGVGLAGMGLGTAAGFGTAELANRLYRYSHEGKNIPASTLLKASPVLGAGMGLAYSLWKAKELEELKRAGTDHKSDGGVSGR